MVVGFSFSSSFFVSTARISSVFCEKNDNSKIIETSNFYWKRSWRWEFVGRGRNVRRRWWVPGPLSNVLFCLLPVEGLPRTGHVPSMDSRVSSLSYTPTPEGLPNRLPQHRFHHPPPYSLSIPSFVLVLTIYDSLSRLTIDFSSDGGDSVWWTSGFPLAIPTGPYAWHMSTNVCSYSKIT